MGNRYYKKTGNRSPDDRRLARRIIEEQYVTGTDQSNDEMAPVEGRTSREMEDSEKFQPVDETTKVGAFGMAIGFTWKTIGGVIVFLGSVIALIVFMNSLSNGIVENKTNIQNLDDKFDLRAGYIERDIERLDDELTEGLNDIKAEIRSNSQTEAVSGN